MFNKILIIGCPGAGKSTFARKLSQITGLPLYHLDMVWHKPDKTTSDTETFDKKLKEILLTDSWIIDGNYKRTLETRLELCDAVFLLDFPTDVCLQGALSRIGTKRADFPWLESELDEEFKKWIIDFPKNCLPQIYETLSKFNNKKQIYIFRTHKEIDEYLNNFN